MIKFVSFSVALFGSVSATAMAATPGVQDYVTAIRLASGHPQCLQVQTANGGGDTAMHSWRPCASVNPPASGTALCFGIGTGVSGAVESNGLVSADQAGVNALGPVAATAMLSNVNASRWGGGVSGPYINFVVQGQGYYGDCPSKFFGIDQASE